MAATAKLIESLASGLADSSGAPYSGYQVRSYAADGTTLKAVWRDRAKTLPGVNGESSFSLDATGRVSRYADGIYVLKLWTATADPDVDNATLTLGPAEYGDKTPLDSNIIFPENYASLQACIESSDSAGKTILISAPTTITDNVTAAVDRNLWALNSGLITISQGKVLTINGTLAAGMWQVFAGTGTVVFGSGAVIGVRPEWFGAKGDNTTDSGAAINKAIVAADGNLPVLFGYGDYLSSVTIAAGINRTSLIGVADAEYTPTNDFSFPPTHIKFTATLTKGVDTGAAINTVLRNIYLDGDDKVSSVVSYGAGLSAGLNGASQIIESCTIRGGTVQGVLADAQVYFTIRDSAISANAKGLAVTTFINALTIQNTKIINNTGIGLDISGTSGFINVIDTGIENNAGAAVKINGSLVNMKFDHVYFECALPPYPTSFIDFTATIPVNFGFQKSGNVFQNCTFNAGGGVQTIVASVASGKVSFRDCNYFGADQALDSLITATAGAAEVVLEDSFESFILDPSCRRPWSFVDRRTALFAGTTSAGIDVSAKAINFGTGDFTLNTVVEIEDTGVTAAHAMSFLLSSPGGLDVSMSGNRDLVSGVSINANGAALTAYSLPYAAHGVPFMLTAVRASGVVSLYINGILADSKADTTDYTANISTILGSTAFARYNSKTYKFSLFNAALTAADIQHLYHCEGDIDAARLTSNRKLNLKFDNRISGKVYDSVSASALTLGTDVSWVSTSTPAH